MREESRKESFKNIVQSKFLRSIFYQVILIFLVVIVAIIVIAFFSFNTEINRNIIKERKMQLDAVEYTVSQRMSEVTSISFDIGKDTSFYLESVEDSTNSSYRTAETLGRYLVGNDFIEHLAYYKLASPDIIYTASGELRFKDFLSASLHMPEDQMDSFLESIAAEREMSVHPVLDQDGRMIYLAYVYPFPEFSPNPQAFVLMLISFNEVEPLIDSQLANCSGKTMIFDINGNMFYQKSTLEEDINVSLDEIEDKERITIDKTRYAVIKNVSSENGWTYLSLIRLNDMVSDAAQKQIVFIVLLLVLMALAIVAMFMAIVGQYKPINKLAMSISRQNSNSDETGKVAVIDEKELLTDTFTTLKDDSDQKKKFEEAYHVAEAANKAKSTFLSNMSHDIRTPMNAIVGMTEIASKHTDDPVYVQECLQNVHVASQYLLDIINNVLDMSRIESGKITLAEEVVEFPKLVSGIITIINHNLEVKSQHLIVEVENIQNECIIGDTVRLTQVFINILSNSVKFTPNDGTLSFKMHQEPSTEEGYGDYVFVFTDTGIGMSQEFISKVFDTFTRDNGTSIAKIEGTGLGMAIAKNFIDLMGGTICCESEMGKGTKFTIHLHMKLASEKREELDEKVKSQSIAILGEEEKICKNQMDLFCKMGVSAEYFPDTKSFLDQSGTKSYDFIIINQSDTDKSGIEAFSKVYKTFPPEKTTYVLAARDMFAIEKSYAFDSGIHAFVQIPLFRSTAIKLLNRSFDSQEEKDSKVDKLEGRRILLVEDNMINRKIAHTMIRETKAEVYEVTNGKEAVDAFKSHPKGYFDMIFMDVQMPVMNGYEATAAIRSIQRDDAGTIPIYAMTANTFDEDVRQVKEAGMNGHIGKPYSSQELYRIMELALR